jgi:hypothetical protein
MTEAVNTSETSANLYQTIGNEYTSPWWRRQKTRLKRRPIYIRLQAMITLCLHDGDSKHLWNVGQFVPHYIRWVLVALMTEVVNTFETLVNSHQTTDRNITEDSYHTRRRENLNSHSLVLCSQEPATGSYPKPDDSSPHSLPLQNKTSILQQRQSAEQNSSLLRGEPHR